MLEVIVTLFFVGIIFYLNFSWVALVVFFVLLALILPGVYSMFFGAPFIPTNDRQLDTIMKLGAFNFNDNVIDLGCGDGKVIRRIARKGVKNAVGYEFSIPTYFLACLKTFLNGGVEKIKFGNFWKQDLSESDVVVCFLLGRTMKDFEKKIWPKLKRGTRVVSNEFRMESVAPDAEENRVCLYVKN